MKKFIKIHKVFTIIVYYIEKHTKIIIYLQGTIYIRLHIFLAKTAVKFSKTDEIYHGLWIFCGNIQLQVLKNLISIMPKNNT